MSGRSYGIGKTGAPAFAERGIVEGFYGRPWSHEQRLDMIRFIGERGMNRFVYAPKDDPLMRREWARSYDAEDLTRISELADACLEHGVDLVYCISPGLSIRYSSDADADALLAKLASVAALGVRRFGLLLDDIPARLQHEADLARFGEPRRGAMRTGERGLRRRFGKPIRRRTSSSARRSTGVMATSPTSSSSAARCIRRSTCSGRGGRSAPPTLDVSDAETFAGRPARHRSTGTTTRSTTWRWATNCTSGPTAGAIAAAAHGVARRDRQRHGALRVLARSPSPRSPTTSGRRRTTTPRRAGLSRSATSSERRMSTPIATSPTTSGRRASAPRMRRR